MLADQPIVVKNSHNDSPTVCSLEFFAGDVVHGQVVHVGLDELKGLLLDHASCLGLKHATELLDHVSADALALLAGACLVEGVSDDLLDIVESLDTLAHAQCEVAEPLVVQRDGPVLAEELYSVGDDAVLVALSQLVEVVLMQADETPQALQNDLFVTHVGYRINQADTVEGELDEVALAGSAVKVVADEVTSVLDLLLAGLQEQRVGGLDVVVDDAVGENTTLALRQEE